MKPTSSASSRIRSRPSSRRGSNNTDSGKPGRVTGRCLCGDIQYEYRGSPVVILHCHCESCRRHTSCPIATFVCVRKGEFRFTKGRPTTYASSPGVTRMHCGRCGSPIAYEADRVPNQIDLYIGTLGDPAAVEPTLHVHTAEQLPWFETVDALPRYERERRRATPVRYGPRKIADVKPIN